MNQTANRYDFAQLSLDQQARYGRIIRECEKNSVALRCEMVGKDFQIVIGVGLPPAKYWVDRLDIDDEPA